MSRDSQRFRKTYSYHNLQPKITSLEIIVDETLDFKHSVRVATTSGSPVTFSGATPTTIDGITLANEDRVLLKDQVNGSQNGIYYYEVSSDGGSYSFVRASDARQGTLDSGAFTYVEEGSIGEKTSWVLTTKNPITIDVTALTWELFGAAGGSVASIFTTQGSKARTTYNTSFDSDNRYVDSIGSDVAFFVSGSSTHKAVFGGDIVGSGSLVVNGSVRSTSLTGSLTNIADGTSYLVAGSNVTITTGSNGAVTIGSTAGGGGVGGSGTTNFIPKFTAGSTLGDSGISDDGATVSFVARNLASTATQTTWTLPSDASALTLGGVLTLNTSQKRLGINCAPGTLLSVSDGIVSAPSYDGIRLGNTSEALFSSSDSICGFRAGVTGATVVVGSTTSHDLLLQRNNVTAMTLAASGVGIGTATLDNRFNVYTASANGTDGVRVFGGTTTSNVRIRPAMTVGANNAIVVEGDSGIIFDAGTADTGAFVIAPWVSTGTPGLRMTSTGDVGIGTTNPNARLDILSSNGTKGVMVRQGATAPASATPILQVKGYDDGTVLWVSGSSTHGARVGIGTTNPRAICMLDVGSKGSTGTNNYVNVEASSTGECGYSWTNGGANPLWKFSRAASTSNISLIEQGSSNIALLCEYSTGYVGIGTNDPSEKLHVNSGNIKVDTAGYGVRLSSSPTNADAQTLDCYSESTISARLYALTGGGLTMSSNKNTLQITKVGRLVTITGFLKIDEVTKPSVSGRLVIDMSVSSSPPLAAVQTAASVWIDQFDATMTDPVQAYIDTTDPFIYIDRLVNGSKADLASYVDTSSEVKILVTYVAA